MGLNAKIPLNYLVFDDNQEAEKIYQESVKINSCVCNIYYINPKDFYNEEDNSFNEDEFISYIKKKTEGIHISLIATDWHILPKIGEFPGVFGWDVIEYAIRAKETFEKRVFLIYSSNMSDVLKHINKKIREDDNFSESINDFTKKALELKINFINRNEDVSQKIKDLLSKNNTISNIVLDTIQSYHKNTIINMGHEYDYKVISEILNDDKNIQGIRFIRELIELSIANFTELNDE